MPHADPCPFVHAAFYLWYGTPAIDGKWLHWDHRTMPHWTAKMNERFPPGVAHTPPDHAHSPYYPARGLYSSSDNATLLAQMRELADAGVDSVMLSWWGQARNRVEGVATARTRDATAQPTHVSDGHCATQTEPFVAWRPRAQGAEWRAGCGRSGSAHAAHYSPLGSRAEPHVRPASSHPGPPPDRA